jgi:hypothetical protein
MQHRLESHRRAHASAFVAIVVAATATGCLDREIAPADPATQSAVFEVIHQNGTSEVDILFVVDDSNSMAEEQAVLADQIEVMARELIHPTAGADGRTPPAVRDLHLGIVTTDMGSGGYTTLSCRDPVDGDSGLLQAAGLGPSCAASYGSADCAAASCPWLSHSEGRPDDGSVPGDPPIWEDFGCIATLGTGGCGFEQQLESSLVALTTQAEAGRPNQGFLRPDSLLAIVYVTDEDDCSAASPELYNQTRTDLGPLDPRCAMHPELLHPVGRYRDAFVALRGGDESRVVVAAITGVPVGGASVDEIRAMVRLDPDDPTRLAPSCETAMGVAYPPARLAELVTSFGRNGVLASICQDDWTPALAAITRTIQDRIVGTCVERELATTDPDVCRVVETLVDDRACPAPADQPGPGRSAGWLVDLGLDEAGRRQCEILPADYDGDHCPDRASSCAEPWGGGLTGWFSLGPSGECPHGQVRFTSGEVVEDLAAVRLECRTALCPEQRQCEGAAAAGRSCDPTEPGSCGERETCVRHNSVAVCGDAESCGRCSPLVRSRCEALGGDGPWAADALVEAGSCCHQGFHCEGGASCEPNRTLGCS